MIELPQYIDTHCHLNHEEFGDAWQTLIPRALLEDTWIVLVGHDYRSSARAIEIAREFPYGVYAAVGLHPRFTETSEVSPSNIGVDAFAELMRHPKVVAVGEVGVEVSMAEDELHEERILHKQISALQGFLTLAHRYDLPLILHARGATDALCGALSAFQETEPGATIQGIVHHIAGVPHATQQFIALGLTPSVTGLAARSHTSHAVIKSLSDEHLLVESECMHLVADALAAPRALPSYLPGAIDAVATVCGADHHQIQKASTKNALRMFSKIVRTL
jgi:TatD DNase family protein